MPTLFISYKRGTTAVAPLMEKLRAAHYRLWFDRDEIHLGDPDWQARIDQGLQQCDGVILNITPAACQSEPVRYEVKKARELNKPIFPVILERITSYDDAIRDLGLADKQHIEDFTDVTRWDEQIQRLLRDLESQGLRVTRHDRRQQRDRNNPGYVLHQTYLKRLAERIGTLNLAQINPKNALGVALEQVYVDSPTGLTISVEVQNWQVVAWGIESTSENHPLWKWERPFEELTKMLRSRGGKRIAWTEGQYTPDELGLETAPFEALISGIDSTITRYRQENPDVKPDVKYSWQNPWNNGVKKNTINLHLNHLAAARDRLVILGAPGSGKSTFVKFLALCLAGSGIDDWTRGVSIAALDNWPHGALTPVYVELRRLVASKHFPADVKTPATADHLWAYIQHEVLVLGEALAAYAEDLRYDLEHGHAVLILDGLDEVPYPEGKLKQRQQQLISLAQSLNTRYATSRIIVASRPYAYEGWTLPGFQAVTITEFEDDHREALASRLYRTAGLDEDTAKAKAQALNQQLEEIDPELKDRPLFVTLMATIYLRGDSEGLPTRRGALYRESILLLLDRWTQSKAGAPSLIEILRFKSLDDLYARLAALAYEVHEQYGEQPGTPEIDESLLYRHLKPLGRSIAAELIPYLSENAGVLVCPGQDGEKDVFHFAHRTFQEYLAAAHLMTRCAEADSFDRVRELITGKPQVWRVPCVLAGDVLADTDRRGDLWGLIGTLLEDDPPTSGDDPRWWLVWLAATVSTEQKLHEQEKLNRRTEQPVRDALIDWTLALIKTPQALSPVERAFCGRALSLLDDPRPGVGLTSDGLPDIAWSAVIPPGEYPIGGDEGAYESLPAERYTLTYSYHLSQYPVTYAQFAAFIDAPDGYHSKEYNWFEGLAADDSDKRLEEQVFKYSNHPRDTLSWYQAMAFCRWLSWRLGGETDLGKIAQWAVRLPTDYEWEIAARGNTGWDYPYGDDFAAAKGNTHETGIGQTSAVGIFPDGVTWCGALDMSGNLWEWCLNPVDRPQGGFEDENIRSNSRRVLRGGSWFNDRGVARAAYRLNSVPNLRSNYYGFRLCGAPSQSLIPVGGLP